MKLKYHNLYDALYNNLVKDEYAEEGTPTEHFAYHYTSKKSLPEILESGLRPLKDLEITRDHCNLPDFAYEKYIFSFLDDPKPYKWIANPEFPDVFEKLMGNIGPDLFVPFMFRHLMLDQHMKANLARVDFPVLSSDEAYVVDWAECERSRGLDVPMKNNISYALSRVPLSEYEGQHILPELIIANCIPADRLRVNKQPFKERSKTNTSILL